MICSKTCIGTGLHLTGDFTTNTLMEPYSSLLCAYMPSLSSKHQIQEFRNQMTSMLHSLASTFTTCACSTKARDCVLITEFVENQPTPIDLGPLIGIERGFRTREWIPSDLQCAYINCVLSILHLEVRRL